MIPEISNYVANCCKHVALLVAEVTQVAFILSSKTFVLFASLPGRLMSWFCYCSKILNCHLFAQDEDTKYPSHSVSHAYDYFLLVFIMRRNHFSTFFSTQGSIIRPVGDIFLFQNHFWIIAALKTATWSSNLFTACMPCFTKQLLCYSVDF